MKEQVFAMNRRIRVAFLLVLFCGLVFAQEHVTTIPGGDISNKRESRGLDLALDYFRKNGAGKSDTAITSILSEDFFSLNPGLVKEPRSEALYGIVQGIFPAVRH